MKMKLPAGWYVTEEVMRRYFKYLRYVKPFHKRRHKRMAGK